MPTPGREAKSLKKEIPTLLQHKISKFIFPRFINRAWERNPYIMYPMKIQNREFFGLNMKFSMRRDYTKFFSKIAPSGKGEKTPKNIQVIRTILLRISKLASKLEIFKMIVWITCIFLVFFHH